MKIHRKWIYVSYLLIRLHTPQPPSSTWYLVHSTCWLSSKPDSPFFLFPHLLLVLSYGNVWSFFNNQIYFLGFQVSWTNRNNVFQHGRRSEQLQIQQRPGRVFGKHNPAPISRASKCRCPTPDNQDQSSLSRHPSFLATSLLPSSFQIQIAQTHLASTYNWSDEQSFVYFLEAEAQRSAGGILTRI